MKNNDRAKLAELGLNGIQERISNDLSFFPPIEP